MANIKWKERFAQVYEDSGVKDKYNEFKGYMSNVAEKLNMPSFDEVRGKVSTYADSFTDKVKEGYVNAKTGFTNLKGDFADDGKLNYSNMDLESMKTNKSNNVQSVEKPYGGLRNVFSKFGLASPLDELSKDISEDKALIEADKVHRMDPRDDINNEKFAILTSYAHTNPDEFKQIFEQNPDFFDEVKLHPEAVSLAEHDSALEPMVNAWKEHEARTSYNVVGAGNSPISQGHKTWAEANAWRQANSPASDIVTEKQNIVMSEMESTMESTKTNSNPDNIVEQQKEAESQKVSGKDSKESSFFDSFKDKVNSVSEQFKSRFSFDEKQSTNERGNESFFSDIFDKFKSNESEVQNDGM